MGKLKPTFKKNKIITGSKGDTTYYEYDGMNRLWRIKDANGHILQQYSYHYGGQ